MPARITQEQLVGCGLQGARAAEIARAVDAGGKTESASECWAAVSRLLRTTDPFAAHQLVFHAVYADWDHAQGPPPAWLPERDWRERTHIGRLLDELGLSTYEELHRWSVEHRFEFWSRLIDRIGVRFERPFTKVADLSEGVQSPRWLVDARLNIADSCFAAANDKVAIVYQPEGGPLGTMTYGQLESLARRVASGLRDHGYAPGDALAVYLPMTAESVAIYLGTIMAGCAVVSISDSFAPAEVATRIRLAAAKGVFTQDFLLRGGKKLPLYDKVTEAHAPRAIVLPSSGGEVEATLRDGDLGWESFLGEDRGFASLACDPGDVTNILFSSGTTGEPKAIPWTHTTPIKCAVDAYLHSDVEPEDVLAWPTNLGWMMGPWLIYAGFMNGASIALYYGAPSGRDFGQFVQDARVTMLGVVPRLVSTWRSSECMHGLDWSSVKAFSSTGESSNFDDMLYLMSLAGYRPVIEYCGGTEIGGGYIGGTLVQPASPATFSARSLGLDFRILDSESNRLAGNGELFIVPPSIGLSTRLLNADHHAVYFAGVPKGPDGEVLRRHGDQMERLGGGYFRAHGRVDDTFNLGGIKVSSIEMERLLNTVELVEETAAIAVPPPGGGPGQLVIYAVPCSGAEAGAGPGKDELKGALQQILSQRLNPLFKVYDVVLTESLPRTASNKIMRRILRDRYQTLPSTG